MLTEADTCRKYIVPKLQAAGWDDEPHSIAEQRTFTDGRIVVTGGAKVRRKEQKRADYILRVRRDFPLAVVEAKPTYKKVGDGLQQAKDYALILGLPFAYASNGKGIVEFDFLTGRETILDSFPTPAQLWQRYCARHTLTDAQSERLLTPYQPLTGKTGTCSIESRSPRTILESSRPTNCWTSSCRSRLSSTSAASSPTSMGCRPRWTR